MKIEIKQLFINLFAALILLFTGSTLCAQNLSDVERARQVIGCPDGDRVILKSIVINKENAEGATKLVNVERGSPPQQIKVESNMDLYGGDIVTTEKQTQIKLLFCGKSGAHEVEILPETKIQIKLAEETLRQTTAFQYASYFKPGINRQVTKYWWIVCPVGYIYVKGRGAFKAETKGQVAGSTTTEYTLEVPRNPNADAVLNVIEGAVGLSSAQNRQPAQAYYKPVGFIDSEQCNFGGTCVMSLQVAEFNRYTIEILPADKSVKVIRDDIVKSIDADFNTLPKFPAQGVIPQFKNHEERRQAFTKARTAILLNDLNIKNKEGNTFSDKELADNYTVLGKIYSELGLGEKALRELDKAFDLYKKGSNWEPDLSFRASRAQSYIFEACKVEDEDGRDAQCSMYPDAAKADIDQAMAKKKDFIPAIVAFINLNLKRSLDALVRDKPEDAENYLDELDIEKIREESINQLSNPQEKSALLALVGEVYLRLADVDLAEKNARKEQLKQASKEYEDAEMVCTEAIKLDAQNLYALKCLGDAKKEKGAIIKEQVFLECKDKAEEERDPVNREQLILRCVKEKENSFETLFTDSFEQYEKALKLNDNFVPVLYQLANLSQISPHSVKRSTTFAGKVIDNVTNLFRIGRGKENGADDGYKTAVQLDPKARSEKVIVPDVTCKTRADAIRFLTDIGLVPKDDPGQSETSNLYVTGQTLKAGERIDTKRAVERGTEIFLAFGKLPENCRSNQP